MAVRDLSSTRIGSGLAVVLISWTGLANGDSGRPAELLDYSDMTATFEGTFGTGGSVTMEGSNDGSNFYPLTDPQGNALTKTGAAMELILETPRYIRPRVTNGDGTTAIQVRILARRGTR